MFEYVLHDADNRIITTFQSNEVLTPGSKLRFNDNSIFLVVAKVKDMQNRNKFHLQVTKVRF